MPCATVLDHWFDQRGMVPRIVGGEDSLAHLWPAAMKFG
jgi:hypothetical protein